MFRRFSEAILRKAFTIRQDQVIGYFMEAIVEWVRFIDLQMI